MTATRRPDDPPPSPANEIVLDCDDQMILAYLFGELSSQQAAALEQRLADDPELNRQLLDEAELICGLAAAARPAPVATTHRSPRAHRSSSSSRRAWAALFTLAASIAIAVVLNNRNDDNTNRSGRDSSTLTIGDEALLIAQAWAANQAVADFGEVWSPTEPEFEFSSEEAASDDSVLAWMVTAVAAENQASSADDDLGPAAQSRETGDG